ncbi:hypothetical protein Ndes2526B_g00942 [Nannochloris sp. 'desiccata']
MNHLKRQPTLSLLLLGPKNSGKSELIKILKEQEGPRILHIDLAIIDAYNTILNNLPPGQTKPVIVIDEANALQLWKICVGYAKQCNSWEKGVA